MASTLIAAAIVSISRARTARRIDGMQALVGAVYLAMMAVATLMLGLVTWALPVTAPAAIIAALLGLRLVAGGVGLILTTIGERLVNANRA